MKILTDLGHPKNVHVLKNLIPLLEKNGHQLHVIYREREHINELCRAFGIPGTSRGGGAAGIWGKLFYLIKTDLQLLKLEHDLKPDLLLSFGSPYLANLAVLTKVPMIVCDDTEQNRLVQKIYSFCSKAILVPACFEKTLSKRQSGFNGYYELAYLARQYFQPQETIFSALGLSPGEKFVVLRFVSWQAVHDISHRGLSDEEKEELAATFSGLARVFISAEGELPDSLEALRLKTPPEAVHQVLAHAALVFSEGATMAAEAAVLGVPTVHCSELRPGYINDLANRHGLLATFVRHDFQRALAKGMEFLEGREELKRALAEKRDRMLAESVDVVEFLAGVIDGFKKRKRSSQKSEDRRQKTDDR